MHNFERVQNIKRQPPDIPFTVEWDEIDEIWACCGPNFGAGEQ